MQSKAETVDDYVVEIPAERREAIVTLRALVRKNAPQATEGMMSGMAGYDLGGPLFGIASQKNNLAFYCCDTAAVDEFRAELGKLDCGKGCIRFRKLEDLPLPAIKKIVKAAYKNRRAALKVPARSASK